MSSAPVVPTPSQPDQSVLSSVVGNSAPTMPQYDNSEQVETDNLLQGPQNNNPSGGSRLKAILTAVAGAVPAGLAGISDKGRPGFIQGVGEGARAEQAAQNIAQDIKFKTFDDQVRATQLHNQDIELQAHTQAQSDAHQAAQDAQHDWDEAHGLQYDEVPNTGQSAMDWMKAQTSGQGSTSIPAGTHLSADGKTILIPKQNDETQAAMLQKYKTFQAAYGLPSLPQGAQFVPQKYSDMLQNRLEGHSINGDVYNHDTLPVAIADLQTNRDTLAAKSGTDPAVLKQLDGTISSMQAKLKYLDDHSASVAQQTAQSKAQGTANVANNPNNQTASVNLAATKAAAVAKAQQPFKEAQARLEQSIKDGDPNTAGQMLANGDIAPSQIISTRNPAFAQQAYAAAKKTDPNYNPQRAEGEFKVANSPTNVQFFGSAKSLTDQGGTLDQLQTAYSKLPNGQVPKLNKLSDWTAAAAGSGATAGFAQTAIGVADDYAKVMGGGQGSDTAREEILKSFSAASSPDQMKSSIDAARAAVGSQMQSRIGQNKAMQRMYGQGVSQSSPPSGSQSQFSHLSASGKFGWNGTQWVPTGR